ncbi:TIR domain-containing protein [Lysinibacillus fusiformis]|uniref:TIR domain-containing protein n=1 Tax=Lysinibacillus fusiformis TaxID=28031 RepID=UPI0004696152|nr:TIR domain-containing protein [Lysinibacillus fusiformis]
MDLLKKISLELNGYEALLTNYSKVTMYFIENLRTGLKEKDIDVIKYSLKSIDEWYDENISRIRTSKYVFETQQTQHKKTREQIKAFLVDIENYTLSNDNKVVSEQVSIEEILGYKIFISHSSKDKDICNLFVELLDDLGIPEDNILYSSLPRFGIPGDVNIYEYLRSKINENFYMFYMLSDNYYESIACLNEMGAAWVRQNEYSTFKLPNLSGGIKGVVDPNRKAWDLTDAVELNNLKNKLIQDFELIISDNKWEDKKNVFLNKVKLINY